MFYAKKAARSLNQQRKSLEKRHKQLLAELAKSPRHPHSTQFSDKLLVVRLELNGSVNDSITFSKAVSRHINRLNFGSMAELCIAQKRIAKIQDDLVKFLSDLEPKAAQQAPKQ